MAFVLPKRAVARIAPASVPGPQIVIGPDAVLGSTPELLALCNTSEGVRIVPWLWTTGETAPPGAIYRVAKRLLDVVISLGLLVLAAPLLLVLAVIIRLESPGPALYGQPRIGQHGRRFRMYKLRTMRAGADSHLHELLRSSAPPPAAAGPAFVYKLPHDPRITRSGRWLRKSSLDELPQLLNVLRGEMSLVGPRPELPEVLVHYSPHTLAWLALPPGLTGWWQVNGRSNHPRHQSTDYDLHYLQHASLALDLAILARTVGVVVRGTGAF